MAAKQRGERVKAPELITLGKRIKSAREAKGLKQNDLFMKIERSRQSDDPDEEDRRSKLDVKTISGWENGAQRITPGYIGLTAKALGISYEEEIYWLGLAGHITPARMPPKERIIPVLDIYYNDICNHPYPAIITDHGSHLWAMNPATLALTNGYEHGAKLIKNFSTFLDIGFDSELGFFDKIPENERFQRRQIYAFLLNNLHRRHEPLWQRYPEIMKERLHGKGDYEHFEKMWTEICGNNLQFEGFPDEIVQELVASAYLRYNMVNGSEAVFKIVSDASGYFYGNLFQIMRYFPETEADYSKANDLLSSFQNVDVDKLKVWKVRDLDEIMKIFK